MEYLSLLLIVSSLFAGILNSVAGGGSFLTFPVLILAGVAPVSANATCTIVLWPASITSLIAFREKLRGNLHYLPKMAIIGLIGGLAGARTLLHTSNNDFSAMVPWLLLIATIIFAFGKHIAQKIAILGIKYQQFRYVRSVIAVILFAITAFYGGFFGAGIGILTLAVLYIMGLQDIHEMNALKAMLVVVINSAAFFTFVFAPIIAWDKVFPMTIAAVIGSYVGSKCSMKLPQELVRNFVLLVASGTTIYFFMKQYF
jgi:uncharacterized membrane protein YfcA